MEEWKDGLDVGLVKEVEERVIRILSQLYETNLEFFASVKVGVIEEMGG